MQIHFVYLLTFANGKIYIGMSKTDAKGFYTARYNNHVRAAKNGKSLPVYHAWRKYGAPVMSILSKHENREDCATAEIFEISNRGAIDKSIGYNVMSGGEGNRSGGNPRIYAIMREKVWDNPEWRKKVSEALKGRQPSQATKDAYAEFCKTPAKAEAARVAWRIPEYRAMKSDATKSQMANGGSAHLSEKFKGRGDIRSAEGKESQRIKVTEFFNTDEGKAAARKGYDAFKANPENVAKNQAALDVWRNSDANKAQMQEATKKAIEKCSRPVRDSETGVIYRSQRDMAKALGVSDALISLRVKKGIVTRV